MINLNERQLALLSTLVYCNFVASRPSGRTLEYISNRLLQRTKNGFPDDFELLGEFNNLRKSCDTYGEDRALRRFRWLLYEIKGCSKLKSLKISSRTCRDAHGIVAVVFKDSSNNAVVVFRGTDSTAEQWASNVKGAVGLGTPKQRAAADFIRSIYTQYRTITLTGHSKGGNLAMFAAVMNSYLNIRTVVFNAQGFGEEFMEFYSKNIDMVRDRVRQINAYNDLVPALLSPIGTVAFVYNFGSAYEGVSDSFGADHYMTYLINHNTFDKDGNFSSFTYQCDRIALMAKAVNALVSSLCDKIIIAVIAPAVGDIKSGNFSWRTFTHAVLAFIKVVNNSTPGFLEYITPFIARMFIRIRRKLRYVFGKSNNYCDRNNSHFKAGGFPSLGQSFIAREAGPELVGTIHGRNAVANNTQIVESVSRGVSAAFRAALNGDDSKSTARVFLDGRQIAIAGQG